jgi:hypothetical protein
MDSGTSLVKGRFSRDCWFIVSLEVDGGGTRDWTPIGRFGWGFFVAVGLDMGEG